MYSRCLCLTNLVCVLFDPAIPTSFFNFVVSILVIIWHLVMRMSKKRYSHALCIEQALLVGMAIVANKKAVFAMLMDLSLNLKHTEASFSLNSIDSLPTSRDRCMVILCSENMTDYFTHCTYAQEKYFCSLEETLEMYNLPLIDMISSIGRQ